MYAARTRCIRTVPTGKRVNFRNVPHEMKIRTFGYDHISPSESVGFILPSACHPPVLEYSHSLPVRTGALFFWRIEISRQARKLISRTTSDAYALWRRNTKHLSAPTSVDVISEFDFADVPVQPNPFTVHSRARTTPRGSDCPVRPQILPIFDTTCSGVPIKCFHSDSQNNYYQNTKKSYYLLFFSLIVITNFGKFTMRHKRLSCNLRIVSKMFPLIHDVFFYLFPIIVEQETVILV